VSLAYEEEHKLSKMQEAFAENVALLFMDGREAMRAAGYSESTIKKNGSAFLFRNKAVMQRITALRSIGLENAMSSLERVFGRVSSIVEEALVVEANLMRHADSEPVRERAARALLDIGKGLLVAAHPTSKSFTAVMEELYAEAMDRKERTVDVEGGEIGEDTD